MSSLPRVPDEGLDSRILMMDMHRLAGALLVLNLLFSQPLDGAERMPCFRRKSEGRCSQESPGIQVRRYLRWRGDDKLSRTEATNTEDLSSTMGVPMGEGVIDDASFLRGLFGGGFDGWVTYEMCSPLRGGGSLENLDRTHVASSSGPGDIGPRKVPAANPGGPRCTGRGSLRPPGRTAPAGARGGHRAPGRSYPRQPPSP
jgi:hypothetical protein